MNRIHHTAYAEGQQTALASFGIKEAGWMGTAAKVLGKGLKWGGRLAGSTVIGAPVGAAMGGIGGAMEGAANNEGWKGMAARGAAGALTGAMPLGSGLVAGAASDMALNHMLKPKTPTGPAVGNMPGMLNPAHSAPGMVA